MSESSDRRIVLRWVFVLAFFTLMSIRYLPYDSIGSKTVDELKLSSSPSSFELSVQGEPANLSMVEIGSSVGGVKFLRFKENFLLLSHKRIKIRVDKSYKISVELRNLGENEVQQPYLAVGFVLYDEAGKVLPAIESGSYRYAALQGYLKISSRWQYFSGIINGVGRTNTTFDAKTAEASLVVFGRLKKEYGGGIDLRNLRALSL